jgi:hypothetical protein
MEGSLDNPTPSLTIRIILIEGKKGKVTPKQAYVALRGPGS